MIREGRSLRQPRQEFCQRLARVRFSIGLVAPSAAATTTTTATTAALFARAGFVHGQFSTEKVLLIERLDGGPTGVAIRHFHKSKAFASTRIAIDDHLGALHAAIRGEQFLELAIRGFIAQVANIKFHTRHFTPIKL